MRKLLALSSLALFLPALWAQDAASVKLPPQILTNQGVVALADAGYDEDFLIDLIHSRQTRFDISVEGLSYLAQHGLCEHVVRVMVARANPRDQHDVVAAPLATGPATRQAGVQMIPLGGAAWIHGAGFPEPQPPAPAPYQFVRRRWLVFGHRWYPVQSEVPTPAVPYPQPARNLVSIPAW